MKFRRLAVIVLLCVLSFSCKEYKIAKTLRDFQKTTITIPDGLYCVSRLNQTIYKHEAGVPLMVFYHDTLSCSSCQIAHLSELLDLYELADSLGTFKVISLFAPRIEESDEVFVELMLRKFEYPLYLDYDDVFRVLNPNIPADERFHSFLLDAEGKPIFVGNPCLSDRLWEIFTKTLEMIDNDCHVDSQTNN